MMSKPKAEADIRPGPALVSVVVPAYNEAGNISVLCERVRSALDGYSYEIVVVDDGSSDSTFEEISTIATKDARVRGLSLSRNFGHQYALLAGLKSAQGEVVISMDADLQHPPELIPELLKEWQKGANIVRTRRRDKKQTGWFKRTSSKYYYRVFSTLCGVHIEEGESDFRLLDRRVVSAIVDLDSSGLFLRGFVNWCGFSNAAVSYEVGGRLHGRSKYTLSRMLAFAATGITSFSSIPLKVGVILGFATSGTAFLELAFVLAVKITGFGNPVPGWVSLMSVIALLFGLNFMLLGFVGIYIGHIFLRVQHRPLYLVERTTDASSPVRIDQRGPDLTGWATGPGSSGMRLVRQ